LTKSNSDSDSNKELSYVSGANVGTTITEPHFIPKQLDDEISELEKKLKKPIRKEMVVRLTNLAESARNFPTDAYAKEMMDYATEMTQETGELAKLVTPEEFYVVRRKYDNEFFGTPKEVVPVPGERTFIEDLERSLNETLYISIGAKVPGLIRKAVKDEIRNIEDLVELGKKAQQAIIRDSDLTHIFQGRNEPLNQVNYRTTGFSVGRAAEMFSLRMRNLMIDPKELTGETGGVVGKDPGFYGKTILFEQVLTDLGLIDGVTNSRWTTKHPKYSMWSGKNETGDIEGINVFLNPDGIIEYDSAFGYEFGEEFSVRTRAGIISTFPFILVDQNLVDIAKLVLSLKGETSERAKKLKSTYDPSAKDADIRALRDVGPVDGMVFRAASMVRHPLLTLYSVMASSMYVSNERKKDGLEPLIDETAIKFGDLELGVKKKGFRNWEVIENPRPDLLELLQKHRTYQKSDD